MTDGKHCRSFFVVGRGERGSFLLRCCCTRLLLATRAVLLACVVGEEVRHLKISKWEF